MNDGEGKENVALGMQALVNVLRHVLRALVLALSFVRVRAPVLVLVPGHVPVVQARVHVLIPVGVRVAQVHVLVLVPAHVPVLEEVVMFLPLLAPCAALGVALANAQGAQEMLISQAGQGMENEGIELQEHPLAQRRRKRR